MWYDELNVTIKWSVLALQAVWPVRDRIQDEGERLRAQGVPPEVIAGMRSINAHNFARQPADANSRSTLTMVGICHASQMPVSLAHGCANMLDSSPICCIKEAFSHGARQCYFLKVSGCLCAGHCYHW